MSDESMNEESGVDATDFFPGGDKDPSGDGEVGEDTQTMINDILGNDSETSGEDADDQSGEDTQGDDADGEGIESDGEEDDSAAQEDVGVSREVMFEAAQAGLDFEDIQALGSDAAIQAAIRIAGKNQAQADSGAEENATQEDFEWKDPEFGLGKISTRGYQRL